MSVETDVRAKRNEEEIKKIWAQLNGGASGEKESTDVPLESFKKEILEVVEIIANRLIALEIKDKDITTALNTVIQRTDRLEKHPSRLKKKRTTKKKAKEKAA